MAIADHHTFTIADTRAHFERDPEGLSEGTEVYFSGDFELGGTKVYSGLELLEGGTWRVTLTHGDVDGEGFGATPDVAMSRALEDVAVGMENMRDELLGRIGVLRAAKGLVS